MRSRRVGSSARLLVVVRAIRYVRGGWPAKRAPQPTRGSARAGAPRRPLRAVRAGGLRAVVAANSIRRAHARTGPWAPRWPFGIVRAGGLGAVAARVSNPG